MLTEGPSERLPRALRAEAAAVAQTHAPWLHQSGLQGLGVSERLTGDEGTGVACLKVYVNEKLPLSRCEVRVPSRVPIAGLGGEVEVDVEAVGELALQSLTAKTRPVRPGYSVAHPACQPGTVGCLVHERGTPGALHLLGSAHVLANYGAAAVGDPILQPAPVDDLDAEPDEVARFARCTPVRRTPRGHPNVAEAALARLLPDVAASSEIALIGTPAGVGTVLRRGMRVCKAGRTTRYTEGRVKDVHFRTRLPYGADGAVAGFHSQVLCTCYADEGDSGAALLNRRGKLVGLHVGGSRAVSFFSRIHPILRDLDVEPVTQ